MPPEPTEKWKHIANSIHSPVVSNRILSQKIDDDNSVMEIVGQSDILTDNRIDIHELPRSTFSKMTESFRTFNEEGTDDDMEIPEIIMEGPDSEFEDNE